MMRASTYLDLALFAYSTLALSGADVFKHADNVLGSREQTEDRAHAHPEPSTHKRASQSPNDAIQKFAVNGSAIPDVDFDIGDSYAGLVPISSAANETRQLFFWFFPSSNPLAADEVVIW